MKGYGKYEPVSRFWACFFAPSIFALLWTQKMETTRKWVLILAIHNVIMWLVIPLVLMSYESIVSDVRFLPTMILEDGFIDEYLVFYKDIGLKAIAIYKIIFYISHIYFMYKWSTKYNLENFGFKTKKSWKNDEGEITLVVKKIEETKAIQVSQIVVTKLIQTGIGDQGRLKFIKECLETGKELYNSDKKFVQTMTKILGQRESV